VSLELIDFNAVRVPIDNYGETKLFKDELWFKGRIQSGMQITGFATLVSYIFVWYSVVSSGGEHFT
jgi:hypothetical protein